MKILDAFISNMTEELVAVDRDNVRSRDEWHNFCSSAVERNITQDEFKKEILSIIDIKEK